MAIPIMATPTLEGEDAMRFYRELDENEEKRVPAEEVRRGADLFDAIMRKNPKIGVLISIKSSDTIFISSLVLIRLLISPRCAGSLAKLKKIDHASSHDILYKVIYGHL